MKRSALTLLLALLAMLQASFAADDTKALASISRYVAKHRNWKPADFTIEKKGGTDPVMYWVIYRPEMKHPQVGGGKSFAIYYDPHHARVLSEAYFQ
jgi:hypothetical protein